MHNKERVTSEGSSIGRYDGVVVVAVVRGGDGGGGGGWWWLVVAATAVDDAWTSERHVLGRQDESDRLE